MSSDHKIDPMTGSDSLIEIELLKEMNERIVLRKSGQEFAEQSNEVNKWKRNERRIRREKETVKEVELTEDKLLLL